MKNTKLAKIFLLVLALAFVIGVALAMGVSAEITETKPEIISQNVRYQGDFALMYAIKADTVKGGKVDLELYEEKPTVNSTPVETFTSTEISAAEGNLAYDSYIITTKGTAAVDMTKQYYVKAIDGEGNESAVMRYSVAEYLYDRLAATDCTAAQKNFYNSVINMGDNALIILTPNVAETPVSDYRLVRVNDSGAINDYAQGIYPIDTVLSPVAVGGTVDKWTVVTYDESGNELGRETIASGESFTVKARTEIYCGEFKTYKAGTLDFESYTVGGELPATSILTGDKGYSASIAQDTVYGRSSTILKTSLTSTGSSAGMAAMHVFNSKTSAVNADAATAYEFSFDIKVDHMAAADNTKGRTLRVYFNAGSTNNYEYKFVVKGGVYVFGENANISTEYATDEYHNFRFKVEIIDGGKLNVYLYIDGSDTPVDSRLGVGTAPESYSGFTKCQFTAYNALEEAMIVNFDNVYVGYINENAAE